MFKLKIRKLLLREWGKHGIASSCFQEKWRGVILIVKMKILAKKAFLTKQALWLIEEEWTLKGSKRLIQEILQFIRRGHLR